MAISRHWKLCWRMRHLACRSGAWGTSSDMGRTRTSVSSCCSSHEHVCIVGNHDWAVMGKVDVEDFNPDAKHSVQWTQDSSLRRAWPIWNSLRSRHAHGEFTLVHGSPRDPIWEYLFRPGSARLSFDDLDTAHALVGHTHVPCKFTLYQQNGRAALRDGAAGRGSAAAVGRGAADHQSGQRGTAARWGCPGQLCCCWTSKR